MTKPINLFERYESSLASESRDVEMQSFVTAISSQKFYEKEQARVAKKEMLEQTAKHLPKLLADAERTNSRLGIINTQLVSVHDSQGRIGVAASGTFS